MDERDLFNLVSVDTTKRILRLNWRDVLQPGNQY